MEIIKGIPLSWYLILCSTLFSMGAIGVLFRRNAIIVFMCVELMLNSVNLLLVVFSKLHSDTNAQVFVLFIMAIAAAEVAVGLAILMMIYRNTGTSDIERLNKLKW